MTMTQDSRQWFAPSWLPSNRKQPVCRQSIESGAVRMGPVMQSHNGSSSSETAPIGEVSE